MRNENYEGEKFHIHWKLIYAWNTIYYFDKYF